ncbi:MAG: SAM-dependent methyltransferase [Fuerstiella sp.]
MPEPVPFIFVCCQFGAEKTCKQELLTRYPGLRFAFSRPGFMTFKVTDPGIRHGSFQLESTFARVWGWSLGKANSDSPKELAESVAERISAVVSSKPFTMLHCWQRDTALPGKNGFEPGVSPVAKVAGQILFDTLLARLPDLRLNGTCKPGERTLCVVLVEQNEWWVGWHDASTTALCWPGGAPPIELPQKAASRAWLKIHEAILWGRVPIQKNDVVAEIGSAPGGAAQYLLERGTTVIAIDPAEMDATVAEHPSLVHVRRRARDVPKRDLMNVRWLVIDINMPPSYTIEVVRDYVQTRGLPVRGIIATLKLPDWKLAAEVDNYRQQFIEMGFSFVDTRQLAFNRQEFCLVALRKRRHRRRSD